MSSPGSAQQFSLLVPVKPLARAKSRLAGARPQHRAALMRAFADDVLIAALGCARVAHVFVVTDEDGFERTGVTRLPDEGDGDLNRALVHASVRARLASPALGVAALCGDLPCLSSEDLDTALASGHGARWFVGDATGTGTSLLVAGPGVDLDPHFGESSASRHEATGAVPVRAEVATLRLDVDTDDDLAAARALGVGSRTAAVLVG